MPAGRAVGFALLMGFVLFVSFRIFTAPSKVVQELVSPDGSRRARLLHVYYYADPGYKIRVRSGAFWRTLCYLPEYKGVPLAEREEVLKWSQDSTQLTFEVNGQLVWGYDFPAQSSRLKSP